MTAYQDPGFTIGIEEEYLLVDPETRNLADDPPASILEATPAFSGSSGGALATE